jgi:hypothetical protein
MTWQDEILKGHESEESIFNTQPMKDNQNEIEGLKILLKDAKGDAKKEIQNVIDKLSNKPKKITMKTLKEQLQEGKQLMSEELTQLRDEIETLNDELRDREILIA